MRTRLILPHLVNGDRNDLVAGPFDALLSYTNRFGRSGGTGETPDWDVCRRLRDAISPTPFILSGGLNAENVANGIRKVDPYAVDVSSGVESSPGEKDGAKIEAFVQAAKGSS